MISFQFIKYTLISSLLGVQVFAATQIPQCKDLLIVESNIKQKIGLTDYFSRIKKAFIDTISLDELSSLNKTLEANQFLLELQIKTMQAKGKLDLPTIKQSTEKLTQFAQKKLELLGVHSTRSFQTDRWVIIIEDGGNTRFSKIIKTLRQSHGISFAYDPGDLTSVGGAAQFSEIDARISLATSSIISLSPESIDISLLHEARHSKFFHDLKRGLPHPYYGFFITNPGFKTEVKAYPRGFHFTELSTYDREIRQKKHAVKYLDRTLSRLHSNILNEMSEQTTQLMQQLLNDLQNHRIEPSYSIDRLTNRIRVTLPVLKATGEEVGKCTVFLIEASDPYNLGLNIQLLEKYLVAIQSAAEKHRH